MDGMGEGWVERRVSTFGARVEGAEEGLAMYGRRRNLFYNPHKNFSTVLRREGKEVRARGRGRREGRRNERDFSVDCPTEITELDHLLPQSLNDILLHFQSLLALVFVLLLVAFLRGGEESELPPARRRRREQEGLEDRPEVTGGVDRGGEVGAGGGGGRGRGGRTECG